ncbi:quinone oxidoreductase family protein [Maribacter arenosus]|uniref:Zinc-binding dehydrogenase n=1 Tax=Maribacter arenosus TaxID=1854708 RepID=A0ABR7VES6_9FLAO|nr:zinc-binding dehydrogenase [Maribacter arenosus]MBD0851037.1 zinc-binding dehydrogenase [Maribacter arenosus]
MKAAYLVKYGPAETAFEIREVEKPKPGPSQVLIKVEAFGLNFADIAARYGKYRGAPPLPSLLGYDVVGQVEKCGANVKNLTIGDRVTALTLFGGYAEFAIAENGVANKIPESISAGVAVALATQYCTAYFLSDRITNIQENEKVLIHAAAGGVGTALVQMALHKKCIVYGTCSSPEKMEYLQINGVHHPINHRKKDFAETIRSLVGDKGLDVVFNPIGGKSLKQGYRLLGAGGRLVSYGVSSLNSQKTIFGKLKDLWQFGIYHPVQFLSNSKGVIGVNMLKIAEEKPKKIARVMQEVIQLQQEGILRPHVGGEYSINQLAEAHTFLESRKSMGKIVVRW